MSWGPHCASAEVFLKRDVVGDRVGARGHEVAKVATHTFAIAAMTVFGRARIHG